MKVGNLLVGLLVAMRALLVGEVPRLQKNDEGLTPSFPTDGGENDEGFAPLFPTDGGENFHDNYKNYKYTSDETVIFCGPDTFYQLMEESAKKQGVTIMIIPGRNLKMKKVVVKAHGDEDGSARQNLVKGHNYKIDSFVNDFFPNAEIVITTGCSLGANIHHNFKENDLVDGQLVFIVSGQEDINLGVMSEITSFAALEPNEKFPIPIPTHILFKNRITSFSELRPLSLKEISDVLIDSELNKEQKIESLFELISEDINRKKSSVLRSFGGDIEIISRVDKELRRMGFRDFSEEKDYTKKEALVLDYLGKYLSILASTNLRDDELESANEIMEFDDDLSNYNIRGVTLLHHAITAGNLKYVKSLVKNGANVDAVNVNGINVDGVTPLQLSIQRGETEIFNYLAPISNLTLLDNVRSAVTIAAENGRCDFIIELIKNGAPVANDSIAVMAAINRCHVECLETLLKGGANPNLRDPIDDSLPLMRAIHWYSDSSSKEEKDKFETMAVMLVESGAEVSRRTKDHEFTPEEFALRVDEGLRSGIMAAWQRYLAADEHCAKPNTSPETIKTSEPAQKRVKKETCI